MQFLVVLVVAPRYGLLARWLRLRRIVPQQVVEDVLGTMLRSKDTPVSLDTIGTYVPHYHKLQHAMRTLSNDGLLEKREQGFALTEAGKTEATRILRAHRLWETYLDRVGTPSEDVHKRAEVLEHVRGEGTVQYLDQILGHPTTDPHGSPIPQDPEAGADIVPMSRLRTGDRCQVKTIPSDVLPVGVTVGETIHILARHEPKAQWEVLTGDGARIVLNSQQAEQILVTKIPQPGTPPNPQPPGRS
jgi:manganese/iron transport system permease protein/iron/zinc/copper transport system permease protein